jgi:hypothetical protein
VWQLPPFSSCLVSVCVCVWLCGFVFFSKKYFFVQLFRIVRMLKHGCVSSSSAWFVDMRRKKFKRHKFDWLILLVVISLNCIRAPLALAQL